MNGRKEYQKKGVIIYNSMWGATHNMAEHIGKGAGQQ